MIENENTPELEVNTNAPAMGESGQTQQPEAVEETEGYEVVFTGDTDAPEVNPNAIQAAKRIARKKEREMQAQLDRLKAGEVDDGLRVEAQLPPQPDYNDYLNDDVVGEKYDYDTNKAAAAYNAAQQRWMLEAQQANQAAQVKQSQNVNTYLKQSESTSAAVREYYDVAEKLNIPDYDGIEERVAAKLPQGWSDTIINSFPDKAAAMFAHLDKNPAAMAALVNSPNPMRDATLLSIKFEIKKGAALSKAPPADTPMKGGEGSSLSREDLEKKIEEAADSANVAEYRKLKAELARMK